MDTDPYPAPWYQCMLPLGYGGYDTAADVVARSFDFRKLRPIEIAYEAASAALNRLNGRVEGYADRYGWDLPSGVRVMCPLQLDALLAVLPENEPLEPAGLGGAPTVPFAALIRAFLFAPFYEVEDNSAAIWRALANNPGWLQRCGFVENKLPNERTLQRFNHVMNWAELWGEARRLLVTASYDDGILAPPTRLAIDPGHEDGYAGVRRPCAACRSCAACRHEEQVPTCDVTDIVTKRKTYQFPGVKGVFVTDVDAEMPLMALGVNARRFDGAVGAETARAVAAEYPTLVTTVTEALLDGAYDARDEKAAIAAALGGDVDVLTPINPRNRKPIRVDDSRGIDHIDTQGVPHCVQGLAMIYRGKDEVREQFRYGCPLFDRKTGTVDCPNQGRCCPNPGKNGRQYRVDRDDTPQVDWKNPQHSQESKTRYKGRTAVERTIARTKRSIPFERHWGRGRRAFQGHLDKGVLALHVFLHAAHAEGQPQHGRKILTWHKRLDEDLDAAAA